MVVADNPLANFKVLYATGHIRVTPDNKVVRTGGVSHTIKGGVVTFKDGTWTGATPGGLIRGPQRAAMLEAAE